MGKAQIESNENADLQNLQITLQIMQFFLFLKKIM
jgi:hypothetical protein